ncbi:MAG: OsmC family protein [Propionicimonas sp.]|nr:OsmC family protein [Propionicimonas sp.]
MPVPARTEVTVTRTPGGALVAHNARGARLSMSGSDPGSFSPVELLLAAIAGCSAIDVDTITSRRAEPQEFTVRVGGTKTRDERGGNLLQDIAVEFTVRFPEGEAGDAARAILPTALAQSHDRLCTVSRTVEAGVPVAIHTAG